MNYFPALVWTAAAIAYVLAVMLEMKGFVK